MSEPLIEVRDLVKTFPVKGGVFQREHLFSVHGPAEFQQHVSQLLAEGKPLW